MYVGSDAIALAGLTDRVCFLEDGDWATITREGARIWGQDGAPVTRKGRNLHDDAKVVSPGRFAHFMAKEIYEQPNAIARTLHMAASGAAGVNALGLDWARIPRVSCVGCGTAFHAGLIGKYWMERLAALPCDVEIASEFRSREHPLPATGLGLFVSQSGETADTLASLRRTRRDGRLALSIVNVDTSTMARESDAVLHTQAGPEIGVASTKAFTCQLTMILALVLSAGLRRGALSEEAERQLAHELAAMPDKMQEVFALEPQIAGLSERIAEARTIIFLGRGTSYALALEGALKLKELTYLHAEGHAAGELKHGPIALIDENVLIVAIAPSDDLFAKLDSVADASCSSPMKRAWRARALSQSRHCSCPHAIPTSRRSFTRRPCKCLPTIPPCIWGGTWTSRAISRNP
jgi:glutamine---fructose-6-phosphate transaminase (isomerizing)